MFAKSDFGYTPVSSNVAGRKILEGNGDFDGTIIYRGIFYWIMEDFISISMGKWRIFDGIFYCHAKDI